MMAELPRASRPDSVTFGPKQASFVFDGPGAERIDQPLKCSRPVTPLLNVNQQEVTGLTAQDIIKGGRPGPTLSIPSFLLPPPTS